MYGITVRHITQHNWLLRSLADWDLTSTRDVVINSFHCLQNLPLAPASTPCHTISSADYSTQTDSPSSLTPSPLHPLHHRFSFREQTGPRRGRLSRFYSQDPEPVTRCKYCHCGWKQTHSLDYFFP